MLFAILDIFFLGFLNKIMLENILSYLFDNIAFKKEQFL